jgi:uncharacterized protein (TIGR02285 family)
MRAVPAGLHLAAALLSCAALAAEPPAAGDNVITWLVPDFPPASALVDGRPGDGIADALAGYLAAHWPEMKHSFVAANPKRVWAEIEKGSQVCYTAALSTPEREKIAYLTPAVLNIPLQFITREALVPSLPKNAAGEVLLDRVLAEDKLRGLFLEKRSYGPVLDAMLARLAKDHGPGLTERGDYGTGIFKMIALGRADYTIDHEFVFTYLAHRDRQGDGVRALPIAGNQTPIPSAIACPRTPWGRRAILRIDKILGTKEGARNAREALGRWLSPETARRYQKEMDAFYRERSHPLDPARFGE